MRTNHVSFVLPIASALLLAAPTTAPAALTADAAVATLLQQSRAALGGETIERVKVLQLDARTVVGGLPGTGRSWQEIGGVRFAETTSNPPLVSSDGYDGSTVWFRYLVPHCCIFSGRGGRRRHTSMAVRTPCIVPPAAPCEVEREPVSSV